MKYAYAPYGDRPECRYVSVKQAAAAIGCTTDKVRLMLRESALPGALRIGEEWRIPRAALAPGPSTLQIYAS